MKTKHLFGLVAAVAVTGLASSAQAGLSIGFVFGLPVPVFHAPHAAVVFAPPCPPPVAYCPPRVVYVPAPCAPVVYAPHYERHADYRDQRGYDHRRNERNWSQDNRGQEHGGHH